MELSDRKKQILKAIVEGYIKTAEPIGSRALMQSWSKPLSSATIRNEMSELEDMGLVEKPHTSAGRVPSQLGYRVYVDELMNDYRLTMNEIEAINSVLRNKMSKLDDIVSISGKIVSELTNHPAFSITQRMSGFKVRRFELVGVDELSFVLIIVTSAGLVKNRFVRLDYPLGEASVQRLNCLFNSLLTNQYIDAEAAERIEILKQMAGDALPLAESMCRFLTELCDNMSDDDVFLEGASKLLNCPEYRDPDRAREILEFLSGRGNLNSIHLKDVQNAINVAIGRENEIEELRDTSVIYTAYRLPGGMHGVLAVVGPTRMDYAKTSACLDAFVKSVEQLLLEAGYDDE